MAFFDLRHWYRGAAVLALIVLIPVALLWLLQRRLVFQPDSSDPGPAAAALPGARDVVLHTADGLQLGAWYLPAAADCATTVLVAPGNGGNRYGRAELGRRLGATGLGVLLLDYRGYGGNPGSPSEAGLMMDGRAALDFLRETVGDAHQLVYFGESLGGAVVVALAERSAPAAVVLRSPFLDLAAAAATQFRWLPVRQLLRDELPVRDPVSRLNIPLTVIYGERDTLIPPAQSIEVAAAAAGPATTVMIPDADHNDPELVHGPGVVAATLAAAGYAGPRCQR